MNTWEDFFKDQQLLNRLKEVGYEKPTHIQSEVLKFSMMPHDFIIAAPTGSGKTMTYVLPIVSDILGWYDSLFEKSNEKGVLHNSLISLVLVPTRELAVQVDTQFRKICQNLRWRIKVGCIVGGLSKQKQERIIQNKPHILVATPGRLLELINDNQLPFLKSFKKLKHLVLDEADRILELGLLKEVEQILFTLYASTHTDKGFFENSLTDDLENNDQETNEPKNDSVNQNEAAINNSEEKSDKENQMEEMENEEESVENKNKSTNQMEINDELLESCSGYFIQDGKKKISLQHYLSNLGITLLGAGGDENEEKPNLGEDEEEDGKENNIPVLSEIQEELRTFVLSATITKAFISSRMVRFKERLDKKLKKKQKKQKKAGKKKDEKETDQNKKIESLLDQIKFKRKVKIVDLTKETLMPEQLQKFYVNSSQEDKMIYVNLIIKNNPTASFIVFTNSIVGAKKVSSILNILHVSNVLLHSELQQKQRLKRLDKFKAKKCLVLIATDVASRGLDIPKVENVLHYELPNDLDTYVHRCGRTARIGHEGTAYILISPKDAKNSQWFHTMKEEFEKMKKYQFDVKDYLESKNLVIEAEKLEKEQFSSDKTKKARDWYLRQAKDLDIELDEEAKTEMEALNEKAVHHKKKVDLKKREYSKILNKMTNTVTDINTRKCFLKPNDLAYFTSVLGYN